MKCVDWEIGVENRGWGKGLGDIEASKQNVTWAPCTQGGGEKGREGKKGDGLGGEKAGGEGW